MALHICLFPGCNRLQREPRCPEHARRKYREPNKVADPFYTSGPWRRLRASFIATYPLCCECEALGRVTPATDVDHIKPRRDFPESELDWDNLRSLCHSCHSRRTRREQANKQGR